MSMRLDTMRALDGLTDRQRALIIQVAFLSSMSYARSYNTEYNKRHEINYTKQNIELTNNVHKIQKTLDCNAECSHLNLKRHRLMKLFLNCENSI